ncbi:MAG: MFS transporter [Planctomycetaceae bacterium]|nr:MFS transporter [Planctomycetaceae bacterium]
MTAPETVESTSPPTPPAPRKALAIIFVTVFIDLLGFGIVLPLLPRYGEAFDASGMTLGLLMSSFSAMQFLFAPLWGRLSDRIGRRPVLIVGLAGSTFFYALFGIATSLGKDGTMLGLGVITWLFITRIGAGIAGATISTAQAYIADVTGPKERTKGMALIGAAFGIGFTFGPLIGAGFVWGADPTQPPPMPGYVAAFLSGMAMLWAITSLPESLSTQTEQLTTHGHGLNQLRRLGSALSKPIIGVTLMSSFLTILAFAQFESTLSLLTEHLGLDLTWNFLIFAYIGLILTVVQAGVVRRLAPKLGEFRMAMIGVTTLTVGLLLVGLTGLAQSLALLMAVVPLTVIGFSFANPSFQALLSLNSAADEQGGTLGIGQSVSALARIAGPVIGLSLKDLHISAPYWVAAGIMTLAWAMTWSLKSRLQAPRNSQPEQTA